MGHCSILKASLTGDEPRDVAAYAQAHPNFPHEATADQWFDESQFESYRELGEHCATKVLANAVEIAKHNSDTRRQHQKASKEHNQEHPREHRLERIFLELRKQWYPHSESTHAKPADHDRLLENLLERLRVDSKLAFLDSQLYPNLQRIADEKWPPKRKRPGVHLGTTKHAELQPGTPRPPADSEELRAGFYFCKELIQFMQTVFHDRQLDTENGAPSNRGWMNLFRRWALSRMFRFTWASTAGTYSARFQSFCEFHLSLDSGEPCVDLGNKITLKSDKVLEWVDDEDDTGLHRYERWLVHEFITAYVQNKHMEGWGRDIEFTLYPLKLEVDSVFQTADGGQMKLNAGCFIVGPKLEATSADDQAVLFFRIRSSMRNMDLARRAFIQIRQRPEIPYPIQLVHELPDVDEPSKIDSLRRRAHREVHRMERENMDRCRWFSQLLEDTEGTNTKPEVSEPET